MPHVLQVLFLSVFILQVVMHGVESQVPGDLRQQNKANFGTIVILCYLCSPGFM